MSDFLIRYGEIHLKSPRTKRRFISHLKENIQRAFKGNGIVYFLESRIILKSELNDSDTKNILKFIPGIVTFSQVEIIGSSKEDVVDKLIEIAGKNSGFFFALKIKKANKSGFSSKDVAIEAGDLIRKKFNMSVDLDHPQLKIWAEIRDKNSF